MIISEMRISRRQTVDYKCYDDTIWDNRLLIND